MTMLRPFFSFYGGKWRDTPRLYPAPVHDHIVEPFAGSAGYSVRYHDRAVTLCDIDPVICGVWSYLIGASSRDILGLPLLAAGETVADLSVCQEAAWLIGFWVNKGSAAPRNMQSAWMRGGTRPGSFWGERVRARIADQVDLIRHWKVLNVGYQECPAKGPATWFVDPPYVGAGKHYRHGSGAVDFADLGAWCRGRAGQVIVCENEGADWLPFVGVGSIRTPRKGKRSHEAVWLGGAP